MSLAYKGLWWPHPSHIIFKPLSPCSNRKDHQNGERVPCTIQTCLKHVPNVLHIVHPQSSNEIYLLAFVNDIEDIIKQGIKDSTLAYDNTLIRDAQTYQEEEQVGY